MVRKELSQALHRRLGVLAVQVLQHAPAFLGTSVEQLSILPTNSVKSHVSIKRTRDKSSSGYTNSTAIPLTPAAGRIILGTGPFDTSASEYAGKVGRGGSFKGTNYE